ncbi:hypothetical protein SLA2020_116230 [Shorea laevis]
MQQICEIITSVVTLLYNSSALGIFPNFKFHEQSKLEFWETKWSCALLQEGGERRGSPEIEKATTDPHVGVIDSD